MKKIVIVIAQYVAKHQMKGKTYSSLPVDKVRLKPG